MPKMKSHSGCKKRFRRTGGDEIKRGFGFRRHHAWARSSKQDLKMRGVKYVSATDLPRIDKLLPR